MAVPLQNRVDPFGAIHAVAARGAFTGNRGVIHDPESRTLLARRWSTRAWIVCRCAFRGRHRAVMGRNTPSGNAGWTELFFLDEVTALAAGHRPCFLCRHAAARDFAKRCASAFDDNVPAAGAIDRVLHGQRRAAGAVSPPVAREGLGALPDAATVAVGREAFALRRGVLLPWRFAGYGRACDPARLPDAFVLLTPPLALAALRAGYRPQWHPSAEP